MNLIYLAKPIYGGWVTLTAHLSLKFNYPIFKLTKRTERNTRDFGYNCKYQNLSVNDIVKLPNILICAVDKSYWEYLHLFPKDTSIIIHDPTELKVNKKSPNPLIQGDQLISKFKVITIRETVQKYILSNYNVLCEYKLHPFYKYSNDASPSMDNFAVSISRIDFDKNIDIILMANRDLPDKFRIKILGAENRIYVHHKLSELEFHKYWLGKYKKQLPIKYNQNGIDLNILDNCKYVIDLSTINNDGGGTQYTFLDAIYNNCILILNNNWINKGSLFISGYNCYGVSNSDELIHILTNSTEIENNKIRNNAKLLLDKHTLVEW
tara:strand:- start:3 stop:971 length:969 start_codon:yes stop_codon:yes gene_type:complete